MPRRLGTAVVFRRFLGTYSSVAPAIPGAGVYLRSVLPDGGQWPKNHVLFEQVFFEGTTFKSLHHLALSFYHSICWQPH